MSTEPAPWPEWHRPEDPEYDTGEKQERGGASWVPLLIAAGLLVLTLVVVWRMRVSQRRKHTMADHLMESAAAGQELVGTAGRKGVAVGRSAMDRVARSDLAGRVQHRQKRHGRLRFGPLRRP
jgi:hypothetical protein